MSVPTIAQLRYILAVHRYGHFGAAARSCGVAQPTLSAQIKRAEEALGVTLFIRRTKPVSLTDKGRLLVEQAHAVVAEHDRLLALAKGSLETLSGSLIVGIIPTLAPYVVPWFLSDFAERYPRIEIILRERTTDDIVLDLKRMRLDVGLLATPLKVPQLEERPLFFDPFYLYGSEGESALHEREVCVDDLDLKRMWVLEDGHCLRDQALSLCRVLEGGTPYASARFEAGSLETLRHTIDASGGFTLIPETFARLLPKDVQLQRVRPFSDPVPAREVGLIHLERSWKSDLIDALESVIRERLPRSLRRAADQVERLPVRSNAPEPRSP